jgi:putative iron-dependent peroxidase
MAADTVAACVLFFQLPVSADTIRGIHAFNVISTADRDSCIGRRRSDNDELESAPASAHIGCAEQESVVLEAFVLRRSIPWIDIGRAGLVSTAFCKSTNALTALFNRMIGIGDGVIDALFRSMQPLTDCYFRYSPLCGGEIDLRKLGL